MSSGFDNDVKLSDLTVGQFIRLVDRLKFVVVNESDILMNYESAAKYLGTYRQKVYALVHEGELKPVSKAGSKQKYFRKLDLDKYLRKSDDSQ